MEKNIIGSSWNFFQFKATIKQFIEFIVVQHFNVEYVDCKSTIIQKHFTFRSSTISQFFIFSFWSNLNLFIY